VQEPPGGTHLAARRHTREAWCSDSRKMLFFIFSWNRNRLALGLYRQALGSWFWALGTTNFSGSRSFRKTTLPDSLTVWFKWKFGRWFTTCCSSLWTVEIWMGFQQREIYITHDWLFEFPNSMITNGWLSVLKCWYDLDWWTYIYICIYIYIYIYIYI